MEALTMARNGDLQPVESRDWSDLIQKTIDDGSRVLSAELRLFERNAGHLLEAQTDRVIGASAVIAAVSYGAALILIGVVFLLNLWLALWLSFVVIGAATAIVGMMVKLVLSRRTSKIAASTVGQGAEKPIETAGT
jgi:VIT1/CCC1 family predicted Fe2+/Mn2+ transporter